MSEHRVTKGRRSRPTVRKGAAEATRTSERQPVERRRPALVKASVIAEDLDVGESTVYMYAKQGIIPSVRVGGSLRFDPDAVRERLTR